MAPYNAYSGRLTGAKPNSDKYEILFNAVCTEPLRLNNEHCLCDWFAFHSQKYHGIILKGLHGYRYASCVDYTLNLNKSLKTNRAS